MNSLKIGFLAVFASALAAAAIADAPLKKIGVVGSANESSFAVNEKKEQRPLKTGDDIFLNDTIKTDAKGAVQVMFLDKSAMTVNPNSVVTIDTFVYNPATSSGQLSINSAKGAMRFIGGALSKKQPVNIKTPVATIGIRGGIADVGVDAKTGRTESVFVYGKEMSSENQNGVRSTTTRMGAGFSIDSSGAPPRAMDAASIAASIAQFHDASAIGGSPGALGSGGVDTKVDSVGASANTSSNAPANAPPADNGGGNSGGGESSSASSSASSGADSSGANQSSSDNAPAGETKGTQLSSDGASGGRSFGPDKMNASIDTAQAAGNLPAVQNLTTDASHDTTRQQADNTAPATKPTLPALPPQNAANVPPAGTTPNPPAANTPDAQTVPVPVVGAFPPAGGGSTPPPSPDTHRGLYTLKDGSGPNTGMGGNNLHVGVGGRLVGNAYDVVSSRTISDAIFDKPTTPGYAPGQKASADGNNYTGHTYTSENGSAIYYRLKNDDTINEPNEVLTMLTGEQIANANIAAAAAQTTSTYGVSGLTFYNFLPDLNRYDNGAAVGAGMFNYNIADNNLLQGLTVTNLGATLASFNTGLAVDWNHGSYFTGQLNWGTNSQGGGMISAFGKANTAPAGGVPVLTGSLLNFKPQTNVGVISFANAEAGATRVKNDVYGKTGGTIDAMLFEGALQPGTPVDDSQLFDAGGMQLRQPVMVNTGAISGSAHNNIMTAASNTRNSGTYNGYAGGIIIRDEGATKSNVRVRVLNTNPNDISITRDASGNSIGASVKVTDVDTANTYEGKFGSAAGNPNQSYSRDQVYAMGQGSMESVIAGTPITATNAKGGVLASASTLANAPSLTNNQQYAHWGVWAAETKNSDGTKDVVNMVPYVAGDISSADFSAGGTAVNYSGGVLASTNNSVTGGIYNNQGTFSATLNLQNRRVDNFNITVPGAAINVSQLGTNHNFDNMTQGTPATFSNVNMYGTGSTGTVNGALFGPNGQNIGGNFKVDDTTNNKYTTGIYIGQ